MIVANCMFHRYSQLGYLVGLLYGEVAMNCMFFLCSYRCKIEQPDTIQHNGRQFLKTEMCMRKEVVLL